MKAGWELKRLGDLCAFDKTQGIHSNLPYVGLEHIESGTGQYLGNLEPTDVKSSTFKFNDSHVLYGRLRPYLNKVLLPDFEGHCSTEIFPIQIKPGLLREYLGHWLMSESVVESINATCTGARMPRADMSEVLEFNIPVPSEQQQRRIVTLLDEAFADIATAKANAEKNLQNARGLFASRMQTLFDEDQRWERVQLEELLSRGWIESHLDGNHGSDYPRKEEFVASGVPYIAARALRGWEVDFGEAKYLTHERAATIRKGLAQDGDVLFAHNATVGPVGILKTNEPFVILGTSLTYYRCNKNFILPEYLAHFMRSPAFVDQYSQVMKQSTRNQVPITKQREFFHVIPPLSIQQKIANDLVS